MEFDHYSTAACFWRDAYLAAMRVGHKEPDAVADEAFLAFTSRFVEPEYEALAVGVDMAKEGSDQTVIARRTTPPYSDAVTGEALPPNWELISKEKTIEDAQRTVAGMARKRWPEFIGHGAAEQMRKNKEILEAANHAAQLAAGVPRKSAKDSLDEVNKLNAALRGDTSLVGGMQEITMAPINAEKYAAVAGKLQAEIDANEKARSAQHRIDEFLNDHNLGD